MGAVVAVALLVPGMLAAPKPTQAMPEFAQATGLQCSACRTIVPLLDVYGRYVQYSAIPSSTDARLFVGKLEVPAPSAYSQTTDVEEPNASNTVTGEHEWGATIDASNRWGTKFAYVKPGLDLEAAYVLSRESRDRGAHGSR